MKKIDVKKTAHLVLHAQNGIVKPGKFGYSGAPEQVRNIIYLRRYRNR